MTLSLTATCTNDTGSTLAFQPTPAIHGTNPVASSASIANGQVSVVTAVPLDSVLGPSPQGSFGWILPSGAGELVFTYDLHDTPISLLATSVPAGYAVPTCTIDSTGQAMVTMTQVGKPITPVMPQIDTIVFLMLENRSLDNVLGWLQTASNVTYYPAGSAQSFDGIPSGASNSYDGTPYAPAEGTTSSEQPCRVPAFDPYEPLEHVQVQLYADGNGTMPSGYFWAGTPPMTGFAYDYNTGPNCTPGEVMGAYSSAQLPVLYGLAQSYAVSDRWFCSVPSQTDPNRAFSVCGTSLGAEDNSDIDGSTYATAPTIFNVLGRSGKTWGLYWQMDDPLGTGEPGTWQPFSSYYFPQLTQAFNGGVYPWSSFTAAAANGTLPNFCYLEPYWGGGKGIDCTDWVGIQGNDYHPPAWVGPAEASLDTLYELLVASPQWKSMLLVITFDEHGGTWDHVAPTSAVPPDQNVGRTGFGFDRLGVRVPTILVSPFIAGPMVFRAPTESTYDFDHTSFLATFCKWAGVDPALAGLGARVAVAPTFEGVLSTTPRSDTPTFTVPSSYAGQGGGVGAFLGVPAAKASGGAAAPMDVHEFRRVTDEAPDAATLVAKLEPLLHRR
jgi:phospholipase C